MSFSEKKFASFTSEKQIKELFALLDKIEGNWQNPELRETLQDEFLSLASLSSKEKYFSQVAFNDLRTFVSEKTELENRFNKSKRDWEILSKDNSEKKNNAEKLPVVLILDNLRSAFNVGSILRTAECFNIAEIAFCGVTPNHENPKVQKTSMGCHNFTKNCIFPSTNDAIANYRNQSYKIFAMETTTNSLPIKSVPVDYPIALVLGNEALGIEPKILDLCDDVFQIPLQGWKNSLNVGICCGIALYEISKKFLPK